MKKIFYSVDFKTIIVYNYYILIKEHDYMKLKNMSTIDIVIPSLLIIVSVLFVLVMLRGFMLIN